MPRGAPGSSPSVRRLGPLRAARCAVAADDAHIGDTTVLDLGEHRQPVLGSLAALAGPQPKDVAVTVDGDTNGHLDRPVGDLAIADLDEDRVDEHHRIDRVERTRLPVSDLAENPVSDLAEIVSLDTEAP